MKKTPGQQALADVAEMLLWNQNRRDRLKEAGWTMVIMPHVNGERVWKHEKFGYQTESHALKWMDDISKAGFSSG